MSVSRLDGLHDVVVALEPLVEAAKLDGNDRPFQIWRNLEAEDSLRGDYRKVVGDNLAVVELVLESLDDNPKTYNEFLGE
jgi:hypothetical protein